MENRRQAALRYFDENQVFMDTVVKENIEKYRKGAFCIKLTDRDGKPVENARISVRLRNHAFRFGANLFMLDELETEEKNRTYKKSFAELLNLGTVPFYWSDLEPEQGNPRFAADSKKIYRRPATDLCVDYCKEMGIEPKCHCLNYDNFTPDWVPAEDIPAHKKLLEKRFLEIADRYADVIPSFEVTNETFDPYSYVKTAFYSADDFVEWSFRTADRYFPDNRLIINQSSEVWDKFRNNRSQYYMQIERLQNNGISHLDSIGFQFHSFFPIEKEEEMAQYNYNPVHLYRVMDEYARFGKKMQITEMTIPAYSDRKEDYAIQAELLEKLYTVFFSHPAMEAVIYWNLVDGYAAWAPQGDMTVGENVYHGGLLNFGLEEKPAYKVLKKLIHETWHTEENTVSDHNGNAGFRGFYGEYEITVSTPQGEKTLPATLTEDGQSWKLILP